MAKVMRRCFNHSLDKDRMVVTDITDIIADNLDDYTIENDIGEVIVVEDNHQSPVTIESMYVEKRSKDIATGDGLKKVQSREFPSHPLLDAPTAMDWAKDNGRCASEVMCSNGYIIGTLIDEQYLKEMV